MNDHDHEFAELVDAMKRDHNPPPDVPRDRMWARIEARREFMRDSLGIDLHPDVLPFSNLPAYLPPLLLRPTSRWSPW